MPGDEIADKKPDDAPKHRGDSRGLDDVVLVTARIDIRAAKCLAGHINSAQQSENSKYNAVELHDWIMRICRDESTEGYAPKGED